MARYIEIPDDGIIRFQINYGDDAVGARIFDLSNYPTVDAVPVVRCKDCEYYQDNNGGYPNEECRWGHGETPDEDDYCSYGVRRGDE